MDNLRRAPRLSQRCRAGFRPCDAQRQTARERGSNLSAAGQYSGASACGHGLDRRHRRAGAIFIAHGPAEPTWRGRWRSHRNHFCSQRFTERRFAAHGLAGSGFEQSQSKPDSIGLARRLATVQSSARRNDECELRHYGRRTAARQGQIAPHALIKLAPARSASSAGENQIRIAGADSKKARKIIGGASIFHLSRAVFRACAQKNFLALSLRMRRRIMPPSMTLDRPVMENHHERRNPSPCYLYDRKWPSCLFNFSAVHSIPSCSKSIKRGPSSAANLPPGSI